MKTHSSPLQCIFAMYIESYRTQKSKDSVIVSKKANGTAIHNTVTIVIKVAMPLSVDAMLKALSYY